MKYEIEVPDGVIPDGYEAVAFRVPLDGEEFVSDFGNMLHSNGHFTQPRLILRRKWQWPEWLNADELKWGGYMWIAVKGTSEWAVCWFMTNHPDPPDKTRVYTNPRKDGGK